MNLWKGSKGQALVEFLALCLVLLPLFLLVPMIAKYQDMSFAVQVTSRYVAFDAINRNADASTWKNESELKQEATRRLLADSNAPVKNNDAAGDFPAHRNPLWQDVSGRPLLRDFSADVAIGFGSDFTSARDDGAYRSASDGKPFNFDPLEVSEKMGLPARGIYTAGIQLQVANLPGDLAMIKPFDALNLRIRRQTSLLVNGWAANKPDRIDARIDDLEILPARAMKYLNVPAGIAIELLELNQISRPSLARLPLWQDVVPEDRLVQQKR